MARPKKLVLKVPSKAALVKQGATLGLDNALITKLIGLFGPKLLALILKWLADKQKLGGLFDGDLLRKIVIDFIVNSRDEVLEWVETGEDALYDALTALVASRGAGLALLLAQYKDKITSLDDSITAEVLDRVIETLKNVD
jgi:hypothetical protein